MVPLFVSLMFCISFLSCASTPQVTPTVKEPSVYKSKDYVIYNLEDNETPEKLAERFLGDPTRAWVVEEANPDNETEDQAQTRSTHQTHAQVGTSHHDLLIGGLDYAAGFHCGWQ